MPASIASSFLRRIQDTLYAPSPPEAQEIDNATTEFEHDHPPSMIALDSRSSSEQQAAESRHPRRPGLSSDDQSPTLSTSPAFDSYTSRPVPESSTRRRQPSIPSTTSSPDVSAQASLRKRILEIQVLNLPEREKARRVQVSFRLVCSNRSASDDRSLRGRSTTATRFAFRTNTTRRTE